MKALLAALLMFGCLAARAEEVVSTGYGRTFEEALQNAKTTATEQVAGTFIVGHATADGETYRNRIDQYNGGLIRRHSVLSTGRQGDLIEVAIRADVDTDKVNNVFVSSGAQPAPDFAYRLERARDDYEKTRRIVAALDDPAKAFVVQVGKITYTNRGELTDIEVEAQVVYSPKWYDDVRVMARTIGREVATGNAVAEALWGLAALAAVVNPALPGTLFSVARRAEEPAGESPEYMACFGHDGGRDVDACYEIRHPLRRTAAGTLRIGGFFVTGDRRIALTETTVNLGTQLFAYVAPGRRVYFSRSAKERTFYNPGILLFREGAMPIRYKFSAGTAALKEMIRIELIIS